MNTTITIRYSTDNPTINEDISTILSSILPYMVDNISIHFDKDEE